MADLLYIFIAIYSIVQFFSGHFLFGFVLLIASSIAITVYDNKKQENIEIEQINFFSIRIYTVATIGI